MKGVGGFIYTFPKTNMDTQKLICNQVSMSRFAHLLGTRVGEAGHPGPNDVSIPVDTHDDYVKIAVINPTAVYNKHDDILSIDAHCYCLAETSATEAIQKTMTHEFRQKGFRPFWSNAVGSRQTFEFDRPTFRGESSGTCCLTNLPSRNCSVSFPDDISASCRVSCCIVRMGALDIQIVSVYFLTGSIPEARKANDYILASIYEFISLSKIPTIVGGDFNIRPEKLESWRCFQTLGYIDAFSYCEKRWGYELPPTCNNKTRNDTLLIPRILQDFITNIDVLQDQCFDKHCPMVVSFQICAERPSVFRWKTPCSWKDLNIPASMVQSKYESIAKKKNLPDQIDMEEYSFDHLIHLWSVTCEETVDQSLQDYHKIDPQNQPLKGLPGKYKGRCTDKKLVEMKHQNPTRYSNDGGYNPQHDSFSMKSKMKVKQVRRIQSLHRSMQNFFQQKTGVPSYNQYLQWKSEWQRIRTAQGYGRDWEKWLLGFEPISFVPNNLPTVDFLYSALQITQVDCEHVCNQEYLTRQQAFKLRMQFDRQDNFAKNTYKILKPKAFPPVSSVETCLSTKAVLLRSSHGVINVRLRKFIKLHKDREIKFGNAICELLDQNDLKVRLKHTAGYIPNEGCITQTTYAMRPDEVGDAFNDFWSPYWNRDSIEDNTCDDSWEDFQSILNDIPEMDEMNLELDNPSMWYNTIHKLKKNKAGGYDGWYAEDLQILPRLAVEHLCRICQRLWHDGFSARYMQARTILLAKIESVRHMGHCRPITILGQLYRLVTKIISDQILACWSKLLPADISGGIPGRGSRLLMYRQQARIEDAIVSGSPTGGFVLDLIKAFNCIPRRPLAYMLRHMGIPLLVVKFWMKSLHHLTRLPQIGQHLGKRVYSTTGVPEGDALSVCGMICVAYHYHQYLTRFLNQVKVGIYADNWGWLTTCQEQNFLAMQRTLRFVHSIRMNIDFGKSWAWATNRDFKRSLPNLELLFPSGDIKIHIVEDAKELGVRVKYNKRIKLGPIKERFEDGRKSLFKIHWVPTSCDMKASLVYAVWQKILYGLEAIGIGQSHFEKLRRSATTALIGNHKQASSWLACCFLHRKILDPQFFALCEMLCLFRQLCAIEPEDASSILMIAVANIDSPTKQSWGPGTAMAVYLHRCGLTIDHNGCVEGRYQHKINVTEASCPEIKKFLELQWQYFVHSQIVHRKGASESFLFHRDIMVDVLRHFPEGDLKGLFLNITGGFQSGASKSMCYQDASELCPFCNEPDTKDHRLLTCKNFQKVRMRHQGALKVLSEDFPSWIWLPIAYEHNDAPFLRTVMQNKPHISQNNPAQWGFPQSGVIHVYTDGSCVNSNDRDSRRAGFSVVVDLAENDDERAVLLEKYANTGVVPEVFRILTTAHVSGNQTPARGELSAVAHFLRSIETFNLSEIRCVFHSDASYVLNVIEKICSDGLPKGHRTTNFDLWQIIRRTWKKEKYDIQKVKAHEKILPYHDVREAWQRLGNHIADEAAKASLQHEVPVIIHCARNIAEYHRIQKVKLTKVLHYLADYNKQSINDHHQLEANDTQKVKSSQNIQNSSRNIRLIMESWHVENPRHFAWPELDISGAKCCSWGQKTAFCVYAWMKTLRWPDSIEPRLHNDVGITHLELFANFLLVTGVTLPITIKRVGSKIHWEYFDSPRAYIQPKRTRAAVVQSVVLDNVVGQLEKILNHKFFCVPKQIGVKTLSHLGHTQLQKRTGYIRRPEMMWGKETMSLVDHFLHDCRKQNNWNLPLIPNKYLGCLPVPILLDIPDGIREITPAAVEYHKKRFLKTR